jgi:hypothetical protein
MSCGCEVREWINNEIGTSRVSYVIETTLTR